VVLGSDDVAGHERRDQRKAPDRHEEEDDERDRQPGVADVAAERHVVGAPGLEDEHRHEDDRDDRRGDQAQVRALLSEELRDLPAVDPGDCRHEATAARSWSLDSPPVIQRKSPSRLARSGVRAVIPMRAWLQRDGERGDGLLVRGEAHGAVVHRERSRCRPGSGRLGPRAPGSPARKR
jgi:hypothetical protein